MRGSSPTPLSARPMAPPTRRRLFRPESIYLCAITTSTGASSHPSPGVTVQLRSVASIPSHDPLPRALLHPRSGVVFHRPVAYSRRPREPSSAPCRVPTIAPTDAPPSTIHHRLHDARAPPLMLSLVLSLPPRSHRSGRRTGLPFWALCRNRHSSIGCARLSKIIMRVWRPLISKGKSTTVGP